MVEGQTPPNPPSTFLKSNQPPPYPHHPKFLLVVDFTFNLGAGRLQTSTLRRRVNQRDWPGAASELRRWVYGGGRVLPGLIVRREATELLIHHDG